MINMQSQHLYGITALFNTPDEIIHAANEVSAKGFTRFDVNTPYPIHGMDKAMRLKNSKLGFFALAFGIFGTIASVGLMSWVTLVAYPLVIGGKPFWSWPAFVPVAFEVTVLLASVLSVLAMIVIYFKFPNNAHPLHDTTYMKRVSTDAFGICIEAKDPLFDEQMVTEFLKSLGGKDISPIRIEDSSRVLGIKLFDPKFIFILIIIAALSSGTTYFVFNKLLYMEPFNWMSKQNKLKPQAKSNFFKDHTGMRLPVEGTVARNNFPHVQTGSMDSTGIYLHNPLEVTDKVLEEGKSSYRIFCSPCHGNFGRGDSRLRGQFPNPPTLHSDKVRNLTDGQIYNIISNGQNVMPGYDLQIPRENRWKIVHYIRALQRAQNVSEKDMK